MCWIACIKVACISNQSIKKCKQTALFNTVFLKRVIHCINNNINAQKLSIYFLCEITSTDHMGVHIIDVAYTFSIVDERHATAAAAAAAADDDDGYGTVITRKPLQLQLPFLKP